MTEDNETHLGDVQKTLFLPLWGRAVESQRPDPLLVDEAAVGIIKQVDFDFSEITQNIDEISTIGWIERSLFCDQIISEFLEIHPDGTVVNIGCGLDTTFERIDNGRLRWYDLDLPDVIELRRRYVSENERRKFIEGSFLEDNWLDEIRHQGKVLFISAGVFYYFDPAQIKTFTHKLLERFPGSEILFDVSSPLGVKIANKKVVESSGLDEGSYLVWGLEDVDDVLAWDPRIKLVGKYSYYKRGNLSLRNRLIGMVSNLLGIQYMIHLRLG